MPKKKISKLNSIFDEDNFIKTAIDCSLLSHIKEYGVRTAAEVFVKSSVKGNRSKKETRRFIDTFSNVWKNRGVDLEKKIKEGENGNLTQSKVSKFIFLTEFRVSL